MTVTQEDYAYSAARSCRANLVQEMRRWLHARERPAWAARLLGRFQTDDLVVAAERLVKQELHSAGALLREQPHVHLTRLAQYLNCEIRFRRGRSTRETAVVPGELPVKGSGWERGALFLIEARRWGILAGGGNLPHKRTSVAHELAHALLYQSTDAGIDVDLWRRSQCTPLEEWICNYMTRLILIPERMARRWICRDGNSAEQIVAVHQGRFKTPVAVGILRWLDFARELGRNQAFAIRWKQYHPMDVRFVKTCLKVNRALAGRVAERVHELRSLCKDLAHEEGIAFWKAVLGHLQVAAWPIERDPVELARITQATRSIRRLIEQHGLSGDDPAVRELTRCHSPKSIRPNWFAFRQRPERFYIPLNCGGAKPRSIVAEVFRDSGHSVYQRIENVTIGTIRGVYRVDAFAHGSTTSGTRSVLAVYEDPMDDLMLWEVPAENDEGSMPWNTKSPRILKPGGCDLISA